MYCSRSGKEVEQYGKRRIKAVILLVFLRKIKYWGMMMNTGVEKTHNV